MSKVKRKNKMKKICVNPNCKRSFIANKYASSHQECCGAPDCKRYMTNKRQKKFYSIHSEDPKWIKKHLECKKRERKERKRRNLSSNSLSNLSLALLKNECIGKDLSILYLIRGIISFISGSTQSKVISETLEQCFQRGQMLSKC